MKIATDNPSLILYGCFVLIAVVLYSIAWAVWPGPAWVDWLPAAVVFGFGFWLFRSWRRKHRLVAKQDLVQRAALKKQGVIIVAIAVILAAVFIATVTAPYKKWIQPLGSRIKLTSVATTETVYTPTANLDIKMEVTPPHPAPGQKATLKITTTNIDTGQVVTNFELAHGKLMHLVGVRQEDLGQFIHIHPQQQGDAYVVDYVFPEAGTYEFWPEVMYGGMMYAIKQPVVIVGNPSVPPATPVYSQSQEVAPGVVVNLKIPSELTAGNQTMLAFQVQDEHGKDIPLGKYLQENMHINLISEGAKDSYHMHADYNQIGVEHIMHNGVMLTTPLPIDAKDAVLLDRNDLPIQLDFRTPGIYKIFDEFVLPDNPDKVYRAEFWINVAPGTPTVMEVSQPPLSRPMLALLSLVFIVAVTPLVQKFVLPINS
jgi:hypothetical protein